MNNFLGLYTSSTKKVANKISSVLKQKFPQYNFPVVHTQGEYILMVTSPNIIPTTYQNRFQKWIEATLND